MQFMTYKGMQSLEELDPDTVVHALVNQYRFNGLGDRNISIAQHSYHCLQLARLWRPLDTELHKLVLVHDFPEFFTSDITTYCKKELGESVSKTIHKLEEKILHSMGIDIARWRARKDDIKVVDLCALTLEAKYCFNNFDYKDWPPLTIYDDTDILLGIVANSGIRTKRILLDEIKYYGAFKKLDGKKTKRLQKGIQRVSWDTRAKEASCAA